MKKLKKFLKVFGPGLITGAADDDPSGIATYSQTGAQLGYGQLWTALFMLPLQTAVQEACGRIGAVTGKGIAAIVKQYYNKWVLYSVVLLVLIANTINIGADIGAMAAATRLVIPADFVVLTLCFTFGILLLEIFLSYKAYARILKWLALSLLAYPITVFIIHEPWLEILRATFVPGISFTPQFFFLITGVLGTTISPYMFFWQASEETEEEREAHLIARDGKPRINWKFIKNIRLDTFIGMIASEIGTWAIIVVGATVLHTHGIQVNTAADAAKALEPLVHNFPHAGLLAKIIFAVGIVGLGLLSVPVLAGSAAYAFAEAFNWKEGLYQKLKKAHGFYGVITLATVIGLLINFIGIDPMQALVVTAVINGIVAVPLLFLIWNIVRNKKIMKQYTSGWFSQTLLFITFLAIAAAAIALFATFAHQ